MKHVVLVPGAGVRQSDWQEPLQQELGAGYDVIAPAMPDPDEPAYDAWKRCVEDVIASRDGDFVLVGHSFGGWVLLKYLAEEAPQQRIAGLYLFAVPYFSGEDKDWYVAEFQTPEDFSALDRIPRIVLHHNRDDEAVPFAHVHEFARRIPRATVRTFDDGGHELARLNELAADIRSFSA